jgi:alpha-glucosidase
MIIYQVYPRSFYDQNNDGVGDLAGLAHKLPYIKSLGVDAVWISPFFKSPMKDFGYDVSDYREVDPIFGSMQDFKDLMAQAKKLGLAVLVDMVISHTSEEHEWFKSSRQKQDGKSDWYLWADAKPDGSPPNNWISVFGGSAWRWDAQRRQYYFHSFLESQPDVNMHCVDAQGAVVEEMRFWLELGVAGFRFDACNHIFQDQLLRDNPPREDTSATLHPYGFQKHLYDQARPEMDGFLKLVRQTLDDYGAFSLAEVGGLDALSLMGDYTLPGRLHSAYSFALMQPDSSAGYVRQVIESLEESIKAPALPCYALSNHDKPRVATRWSKGRDLMDTAKSSMAMLLCLRGDICLYQGEELGLPQAHVPFERLRDPYGINFWPKFKGRDGCRTPMPWTGELNGGFCSAEPWLPVDQVHIELSVESQEADPDSMLHFTRALLSLRSLRSELSKGSLRFMEAPEGVLAFLREDGGSAMLCIFNMDVSAKSMPVPIQARHIMQRHAALSEGSVELGVSGFCLLEIGVSMLA